MEQYMTVAQKRDFLILSGRISDLKLMTLGLHLSEAHRPKSLQWSA